MRKNKLLAAIAFNKLNQLDNILKDDNNSILLKDTIIDHAGRQFKSISPLQYTAWTLNVDLLNKLLGSLHIGQRQIALEQLVDLDQRGTEYGNHYDFDVLNNNLKNYITNFKEWDNRTIFRKWVSLNADKTIRVPLHIKEKYYCDAKSLNKKILFIFASQYSLFFRYFNYSILKMMFWNFILFFIATNIKNNLYYKTNYSFQSLTLLIEPTWSLGKYATKDFDDLDNIFSFFQTKKQEVNELIENLKNAYPMSNFTNDPP